jgi:multiple sugar transport system permease protein
MLVPFLWMVSTSLMGELEVHSYPPRLVPAEPQWQNYPAALSARPFGRYFLNSLVFAVAVVAGQLVTAATAGYAFARL